MGGGRGRRLGVDSGPHWFRWVSGGVAGALGDYCARWCKREHVKSNALNN